MALDWRVSVDFLALLTDAQRTALLRGSRRVTRPAGDVLEYPTAEATGDLIESGLVRAFQVSDDGRQATLGYLHPREFLAALPSVTPRPAVFVQHVTPATLLRLDRQTVRRLYDTDIAFARALAIHTSSLLARVVRVVTIRSLGSVGDRIAFDLLERASDEQLRSRSLEFQLTQQELADSIGSVREVVGRRLAELRADGVVTTTKGRIRVDRPAALADAIRGLVA